MGTFVNSFAKKVGLKLERKTGAVDGEDGESTLLHLLFWHAAIGVHIRRHQPPPRTVLGQDRCFVQCEGLS